MDYRSMFKAIKGDFWDQVCWILYFYFFLQLVAVTVLKINNGLTWLFFIGSIIPMVIYIIRTFSYGPKDTD